MARDQFVRLFRVGRSSISSIRSLSWASPLTIVTDVERSVYCFGFVHQTRRLTTALPVDRKEEREPTLVKSDDAAVDTTTKTTRTNRRGDRRGVASYEKQVAIHDPKYAEQRKEWGRKAGVFNYQKQVGIHNPKYAEQRKEWGRKAGKIGGKIGGKINGVGNTVQSRGFFDPYNVTDWAAGSIHCGTANRTNAEKALEKKLPGFSEEVEGCVRYQELSKELRQTISRYRTRYINECGVPAELFFDALRPHLLRLENLPPKVETFLEDLPSMRKEELWRRRNRARRAANGVAFHANARLLPLFRETAVDENDHDRETHTKQGHVPQPAGLFPARLLQAWELSADRLDALEGAYGRTFGGVGVTIDARRKDFLMFIGCKTESDMPASDV
jgi:hypothetical protein